MSIALRTSSTLASALSLAALVACSQPGQTTAANSPAVASPGASAAPSNRVRGTIAAVTPTSITVSTAAGSIKLALLPSSGVLGVVGATAADLKPGTFVGIANAPAGGSMQALDVVIFPESMRGMGEGNYPWNPQGMPSAANTHGSMMTNGTVTAGHAHGSMMTNGTVASGAQGQTITITYKGGAQPIVVPAGAPIVRLVPGTRALLVPGAHVFVMTTSTTGRLNAARIMAGERGVVPPM
jgi:hypothetical protein